MLGYKLTFAVFTILVQKWDFLAYSITHINRSKEEIRRQVKEISSVPILKGQRQPYICSHQVSLV